MNGQQLPLPGQPGYPGQPQMQPGGTQLMPPQQFPGQPVQTAMPVQPPAAPAAMPAQAPAFVQPAIQPAQQLLAPPGGLSGVQVYEPDMTQIKAMADEIATQGPRRGPSDFYSFKVGDNYIRLLPPWSAVGKWNKYGARHYNLLGDQSSPCYESTHPGAGYICPIDRVLAVFRQFVEVDKGKKSMGRRAYHYANGLVYDYDPQQQQFVLQRLKPYVVQLPIYAVSEPMVLLMGRPPFHKLMDLYQGCILCVTRPTSFEGKANYTVRVVWTGPLAPDESAMRTILSQMHNLDSFAHLAPPSLEQLQAQVELANALANALCAKCGFTRAQVAQQGLLPEVLALEGAGAAMLAQAGGPAAIQTAPLAVVPTAVVPGLATAPMAAAPSPFPVSPVAVPGPVAPVAAPMLTMPPTMAAVPPAPVTVPTAVVPATPPPVVAPMMTALPPPTVAPTTMAPMLPVQVQGSATPGSATVTPNVWCDSSMPAGPVAAPQSPAPMPLPGGIVPLPVQPTATAPQLPAQQQQAPAEAAADGKETLCPICGNPYAGVRGLKMHLARSDCGAKMAALPATAPQSPAVPSPPPLPPAAAAPQLPPQQQAQVAPAPVASVAGTPPCYRNYGSQIGCPTCVSRNECMTSR